MKTRAFKKVLSVICVLAMLMSVCVVSLVGTTSAATDTYALNINGVVSNQTLEVGAAIPAADSGIPGVTFEGWYDSIDFTKKVDKAGAEKTLYAKFSSTIINFDGAEPGLYNPNNNIMMPVSADPSNSANKAIKYAFSVARPNVGFETYAGSGKGFEALSKVVGEETVYPKYELSFRYYVSGTPSKSALGVQIYYSAEAGIGASGNKTAGQSANLSLVDVGEWKTGSIIIQNNQKNIDAGQTYPLFTAYYGTSESAAVYFDDFVITEIEEKEYTYYQLDGTVEKQVAIAGDSHVHARGAYFQGWYDETLTWKFDRVPASVTSLYAKYNKITYDFEKGGKEIYDPNSKFGKTDNGWKIVADPDNANNKVVVAALNEGRYNFGFNGANGAKAGMKLVKGQEYTVSFKYKTTGVLDENAASDFTLYTATDAGVGVDGNKVVVKQLATKLKNSAEWIEVSVDFIPTQDFATYPNLLFSVRGTVANDGGKVYVDDITVGPKQLPVSTEDFTMDFEGEGDNDFAWSVPEANIYTYRTGNSYVSRGELVEEADGNVAFGIKHFAKKDGSFYFVIDDGEKLFNSINYGLYTISFKYKVIHSETPTAIGLAYVDGANGKFKSAGHLVEFEYRDDTEWSEVVYTFGTDLYDINSYTNFALFVYNSTNVPEINIDTNLPTASYVLFDDIVVKTHAEVSEMGMIRFDSKGGDAVEAIIRPAMKPVGTLPEPTKYGFDFMGWQYNTTDAEGNVISHKLNKDTLVPDFVTDAYAVWQVAEGFVQFDFRSNVDEFDAKMPVLVAKPGEVINNFPTEKPEAVGQKFLGWYTDRTFKTMVDPNKAPAESCTLFAKWESTGEIIDFEEYPTSWFKSDGRGTGGPVTDRVSIVTLDDGNHVMYYNFSSGDNQSNTSSIAGGILAQGDKRFRAIEGMTYTLKFKYKVLEAKASGAIGSVLSSSGALWTNRQEQTGRMNYGKAEDKWLEGTYSFTAVYNAEATSDNCNYISIGCSNDCKIYIDDVVLICDFNEMNVYGSAVIFETNGGKDMDVFSGDPGTEMKLPDPVRPGYKFMGWYTDKELTKPLTQKTFGEETLFVYAKWQLGKFVEDFEEFPKTVMSVGVHGAFSLYTKSTAGFDATNVKSGETSLFRNGATAGVKNFTAHRSTDLALTVGETYTLSFYVKPTSVGDVNGTISIMDLKAFTGINQGTIGAVVAKVSDLKQGEWNLVTYTFTATSEFIGLSTTAGNDMYFDDVTVTLKGYTGSANTGDSSVSPILVLMMVIVSAGALIVTGKKVFSK